VILQSTRNKVIIYGGNGFVGTHLAEKLSSQDICVVCLSRSGHKPLHLKDAPWSESVRWCKGDANAPDEELLSTAEVVVIFNSNGEAPSRVIDAALKVGVKRIVLMGAQVPFILNKDFFAYSRGKRDALKDAKEFAETSDQHSAVVFQPAAIYGKRRLASGKVLPLDTFMSPLRKVLPSLQRQ